jgi:hypothetical protein
VWLDTPTPQALDRFDALFQTSEVCS